MTTIFLYGGPLKGVIVDMAYEEAGQAADYGIEPEEYQRALGRLDAMLAEWQASDGIAFGYNFAGYGNGDPADESGIPSGALQVVVLGLAMRLAPTIGKAMSAESKAAWASSYARLCSAYTVVPTVGRGHITPAGAGNRWTRRTYLPVRDDVVATPGYPVP